MRSYQFLSTTKWHLILSITVALGSLLSARYAQAVTPDQAEIAFKAFNKIYWDPSANFFRKEEQGSKKADFWLSAQIWDTVMDQYDRTYSVGVKRQINDIYDGFIEKYPDWTTNKYNDDIMWWAIACTRAYEITGDERYLKKAKVSFDFVYDNFLDDTMGGGLYWINQRTSKNSCINSPAVIASVRLSVLLKDASYLEKAKSLYHWQKKTLTDGTGKVFDSISYDKSRKKNRIARFSLTYNQGTFIGAAALLYQQTRDETYLNDAIKTAKWTRNNLCVTDQNILKDEGQGDGGAFKGIFIRYMKLLIDECGRTEFLPWMKANANSVWQNRRPTDNITGNDWTVTTGTKIQSQTAASALAAILCFADRKTEHSGNPLFDGWYADPEGIIIGNEYWIYPTYSAPYDKQLHFDAFSSKDLVTWTKHERIISNNDISWLRRALWAPAIVEKDSKYYLFFGANDVHEGEIGGIGVAVADEPSGPFKDLLGKPLIGKIHNGAQPIDQFVFLDEDGQYYMIYGGWSHCNIARLKDNFTGFIPFDDGTTFKEITPKGYVEGPIMFRRNGRYYFMWSEGGWGGPNYSVAYAIADSPLGPFKRISKVLQQDSAVATGAGHHSVIHDTKADIWYAIYHRRPLTETDANHRVTCIDRMYFDDNGFIKPIKITREGVERRTLNKPATFTNPVNPDPNQ